jgi:hypothetical protein
MAPEVGFDLLSTISGELIVDIGVKVDLSY